MGGCHTVVRRGPAAWTSSPPPSLSLSLSTGLHLALSEELAVLRFTSLESWRRGRHCTSLQFKLFCAINSEDVFKMLRLIFLAALAGFTRASDVLDYTDDDFESKIGDHDLALVEFFAPWWVFSQFVLRIKAINLFASATNANASALVSWLSYVMFTCRFMKPCLYFQFFKALNWLYKM